MKKVFIFPFLIIAPYTTSHSQDLVDPVNPGYNVDVIAYDYKSYSLAAMNIFNQIYNTNYSLTSGFMLLPKAWWHYQIGAGEPLFVDASSLNFKNLRQTNITKYNILQTYKLNNINNTSLTIGNVEVTKVWDNQFFITDEDYDFDFNQGFSINSRNFGTLISRIEHKKLLSLMCGGDFHIYYVGTATIMP
jgi:hypothetical protein